MTCCMPCPVARWTYPDSFYTMSAAAQWVAVVGTISCVGLMLSWIFLPVEKTNRHYLSICLTVGVTFMNVSSPEEIIPSCSTSANEVGGYTDSVSFSLVSSFRLVRSPLNVSMQSRPTLCIPALFVLPRVPF